MNVAFVLVPGLDSPHWGLICPLCVGHAECGLLSRLILALLSTWASVDLASFWRAVHTRPEVGSTSTPASVTVALAVAFAVLGRGRWRLVELDS